MAFDSGITQKEFDEMVRANEAEDYEKVKHFFVKVWDRHSEKPRKYQYPVKEIERAEYKLLLNFDESRDCVGGAQFLLALVDFRYNVDPKSNLATMRLFAFHEATKRSQFQINVYARVRNIWIGNLTPMCAKERTQGEYPVIRPSEEYQGPIWLPYLAKWIRFNKVRLLPY